MKTQELFVPYEIAVQLKEKGFELNGGFMEYAKESKTGNVFLRDEYNELQPDGFNKTICVAPLYQQVLDFFREEHNLNIWLIENPYTQGKGSGMYEWNIKPRMVRNQPHPQPMGHGSGTGAEYYEALNNALKHALTLI